MRSRQLEAIEAHGRLGRQAVTRLPGYRERTMLETTTGRNKALVGSRPRARHPSTQHTEAAIGVAIL
jgi:hypothetical protein